MQNKRLFSNKELFVAITLFLVALKLSPSLAVGYFLILSAYGVYKSKQEKILARKRVYISKERKGRRDGQSRRY